MTAEPAQEARSVCAALVRCPVAGCGVWALDVPADRWCLEHGAW